MTATAQRQKRDLTVGSIPRWVAILSAPGMAEMALMTTAGLVHSFWMGRVGGAALSALAVGTTLEFVLLCPFFGLSTGSMAVVARHVGASELRQADRAAMQALLLFMAILVPLVVASWFLAPTFLRWMGATGDVHTDALVMTRTILAGLFLIQLPFNIGAIHSGAGHPEFSFYTALATVMVTIVSETILGLGIGPFAPLTIRGAAWSMVLGGCAGVVIQLTLLISGRGGVRLHWRDVRPDWAIMRRILRIGIPTMIQRFSPNLASALMVRLVASFGNTALAAYALITQLNMFISSVGIGAGVGIGAFVGQNLGAGNPTRASRAVGMGTWGSMIATLALVGVLNLFPRTVLGFFSLPADALDVAVVALAFGLIWTTAMALSNTMGAALLATGDAMVVMAISMISLWLGQLGLAWLLSTALGLGTPGIWAGFALGWVISGVGLVLRYRQGKWRHARV